MRNATKSYLILAAMLFSGMIIGGAATATFIRHNIDSILARSPDDAREDFLRALSEKLDLNATQREFAQSQIQEMHEEAYRLHVQSQTRLRELLKSFAAKLESVLDERQRQNLQGILLDLQGHFPPPPLLSSTGSPSSVADSNMKISMFCAHHT